jgi:hypothetical protein
MIEPNRKQNAALAGGASNTLTRRRNTLGAFYRLTRGGAINLEAPRWPQPFSTNGGCSC